jgi:hypothetical protein
MKYRVTSLLISDMVRFTVETKKTTGGGTDGTLFLMENIQDYLVVRN